MNAPNRLLLLGAVALLPVAAWSQTATPEAAPRSAESSSAPTAPMPGANSFTEGQARSRIEDAGFADVTELRKDEEGIWRGRASRGGTSQEVALDYRGNLFAGSPGALARIETDRSADRPATGAPAPAGTAPTMGGGATQPGGTQPGALPGTTAPGALPGTATDPATGGAAGVPPAR